jgi:hypothetical protein
VNLSDSVSYEVSYLSHTVNQCVKCSVEEALAKYKTVDEAMGEIRRLSLEGYKLRERNDPKKVIDEVELERYLADEWDVQTVLPSGRILIRRVS